MMLYDSKCLCNQWMSKQLPLLMRSSPGVFCCVAQVKQTVRLMKLASGVVPYAHGECREMSGLCCLAVV
jgi:hypothetical protein